MEVMVSVFNRPLQQHCMNDNDVYAPYRRLLFPTDLSKCTTLTPLHLVWVPSTTDKAAPFSHVVAAKPIQRGRQTWSKGNCGASLIGRCLNRTAGEYDWVECTSCKQWFHCGCVSVTIDDVSTGEWYCGCTIYVE
jgi:hypothetical protein